MNFADKNILIVDDEKNFRDSMRFYLEDYDYNVIEAENGRIGTEKITSLTPDLVLIDLYMPEMSGLDVLAWVKDNAPETPIIIISGTGVIHDVAEALRLGAWDYLFKPIEDLSVLGHAVHKAFERAAFIEDNRNYQAHLEEEVAKRTQALKQVNAKLLQKQLCIERAAAEEHTIGHLLSLSLQSKDVGDFLRHALGMLLEEIPWFSHSQQAALFSKPCALGAAKQGLELTESRQLTEEQQQQCASPEFAQTLLHRVEQGLSGDNAKQNSELGYYYVPIYVKQSVSAVIVLYLPGEYRSSDLDTEFLRRIGDVLSMGSVKYDAEQKIQYLAYHDALTGLSNRCWLLEQLHQDIQVAARNDWHGALLFIDIDRFKNLNDALGHILGDELLKQVGVRLKRLMRGNDVVARLGGDEFVVLLMEQGQTEEAAIFQAQTLAENIRTELSKPYQLQGYDYYVTSSIGIGLFPTGEDDSTDLLKHADTAMYRAKAEGGDTSRFYQPSMQKLADQRLSLEKDLRVALENEEMELYYQPQVVIDSGFIIGAEALLRWKQPSRGWVSPVEFIPVAEETGLILDIGEFVLNSTIHKIKEWYDQGLLEKFNNVAANVSPLQFRQSNFVDIVMRILNEVGLPPAYLKLEITESTVIDNVEEIIRKMHELKAIGVHFSMDDFGTGYSSLSYLRRLPLDQLKIDRSFVHDILTDANDAAIVETIISMGHHLGLDVIAEGVETNLELEFLLEHGCNAYQGYYFSRPVPAHEFEQLIRNQNGVAGQVSQA